MFPGSLFVVLLVVFVSQALGQNNTTVSPNTTFSSAVYQSSITTTINTTTGTSEEKTCFLVGVLTNITWHEDYTDKSSERYKILAKLISCLLEKLFGKHMDVKISYVNFKNIDGKVFAEVKLCLVFKEGEDSIKDVFFEEVKTGKLGENLTVIKDSAEFKALEVEYKNYEAKEGECDKCDGAGGPFEIVGECVPNTGFSCNGLEKTKTKETEECTTYCSSTALTVSSLILAIGIFLSSSFQ